MAESGSLYARGSRRGCCRQLCLSGQYGCVVRVTVRVCGPLPFNEGRLVWMQVSEQAAVPVLGQNAHMGCAEQAAWLPYRPVTQCQQHRVICSVWAGCIALAVLMLSGCLSGAP